MVYIETPRLLLRDWKEEDFVPFAEMNRNPSVMEFFLHPLSEEESRSLFDTVCRKSILLVICFILHFL